MMYTQESFYKSKRWETFRQIIIGERTNSDGYVICEMCGKPIVKKYDLIVDHIIELNDANVNDFNISLNPDNVRCVHFKCHNERHKRFGFADRKRVYLVYGPMSMKRMEWIKSVAGKNDLVVDMNSIYEMISINPRYTKPHSLRSPAFQIRDSIYDIIKYRSGKWENAYVSTGGARSGDRRRLMARVGADEPIFIDTPQPECLAIVEASGRQDWVEWVNKWFDEYQPD